MSANDMKSLLIKSAKLLLKYAVSYTVVIL